MQHVNVGLGSRRQQLIWWWGQYIVHIYTLFTCTALLHVCDDSCMLMLLFTCLRACVNVTHLGIGWVRCSRGCCMLVECVPNTREMVKILVTHGANINLHGGSDWCTPLFYAVMAGFWEEDSRRRGGMEGEEGGRKVGGTDALKVYTFHYCACSIQEGMSGGHILWS